MRLTALVPNERPAPPGRSRINRPSRGRSLSETSTPDGGGGVVGRVQQEVAIASRPDAGTYESRGTSVVGGSPSAVSEKSGSANSSLM